MYKAKQFVGFAEYNAWLFGIQQEKRITITNIIPMSTYFIVTYFEEELVNETT